MPGPQIEGSRVSPADVDRFERCNVCDESVDYFLRIFERGEPYYWCIGCLAKRIKMELDL